MINDRQNRFRFYAYEPMVIAQKFIINSAVFISEVRVRARYELFKTYSINKGAGHSYTNRCIITGHPRVPFRKFRVSRMEFRRLAKSGFFKGFRKSSWLIIFNIIKCDLFIIW
jgi:ribosomal protein S14